MIHYKNWHFTYTYSDAMLQTDVLSGYNGTIFAYGQTSSGKTHTMEVCAAEIRNVQLEIFKYLPQV